MSHTLASTSVLEENWFHNGHTLPPGFGDEGLLYAGSVFGLMTIFLLTAEWLWRVCWAMVERRYPVRHPITISRVLLLFLLLSIFLRVVGDVTLTMLWPEISPGERIWLAHLDRLLDGLAAAPLFIAWLTGILGGAMMDWQLIRQPIPVNLWPTWRHLRRPTIIGAWVLAISLAVTFLR